ncbi:hypothetical protein ON010_g15938 [Phytophthora cinnamomi]|nr:hypothetical protein ON010_g15938 [Phytophthora cinnamomi]
MSPWRAEGRGPDQAACVEKNTRAQSHAKVAVNWVRAAIWSVPPGAFVSGRQVARYEMRNKDDDEKPGTQEFCARLAAQASRSALAFLLCRCCTDVPAPAPRSSSDPLAKLHVDGR